MMPIRGILRLLNLNFGVQVYNTLRYGWSYVEEGLVAYEKKYKEQNLKRLRNAAKHLGMQLIPKETTP